MSADEQRPHLTVALTWLTDHEVDRFIAEYDRFSRLTAPGTHPRTCSRRDELLPAMSGSDACGAPRPGRVVRRQKTLTSFVTKCTFRAVYGGCRR